MRQTVDFYSQSFYKLLLRPYCENDVMNGDNPDVSLSLLEQSS